MEDKVLTCLTCHVAFAELSIGRDHYRSEWHRYNTKRKVALMEPLSEEKFKSQMSAKQDKNSQESENRFCRLCNKLFKSQNVLASHLRSKKHMEMDSIAQEHGIHKSQMVIRSTSKTSDQNELEKKSDKDDAADSDESWDEDEEILGLEECLFCSHISSSIETNLSHMTINHSFFLPDTEFISDLEGLIVYLGEMISQGHMCLWCAGSSKMFQKIKDVQKHMLDKGHCKLQYDNTNRDSFSDFYDYRSSYPDADKAKHGDEIVEQDMLTSNGFELVLPSGNTVGHRSLVSYYKQNYGGRRHLTKVSSRLSRVLASFKALGWTGSSGLAVKQAAQDVRRQLRMRNRHRMKLGIKANKMQFHYREQNPK